MAFEYSWQPLQREVRGMITSTSNERIFRICGNAWAYCSGKCNLCSQGNSTGTNRTELVKQRYNQ